MPQQVKGPQTEINKRRSMALALLQKRRVVTEAAAGGEAGQSALDALHREANKIDGFMVLPDSNTRFEIIEGTDKGQLQAQVEMLHESEREFQEISGPNQESLGYKGQALSGIAQQHRENQGNTIIAQLFENYRHSRRILGNLQWKEVKGQWKSKKILRITDSISGTERYVTLNERVLGKDGKMVTQNNITQGVYDIVISEAPTTDTIREANLQLITEAVKKSPPEVIPQLITMAFEMSALPNKEVLVAKLQQIYNIDPMEQDLSPEQVKERALKAMEDHQQQAQQQAQFEGQMQQIGLEKAILENEKLKAEIARIMGSKETDQGKLNLMKKDLELQGFKAGVDVADKNETRSLATYQARINREAEQEEKGARA